jgi:hypothetical protein
VPAIQSIAALDDQPLPVNGTVSLDPNQTVFSMEQKRELLAQFKN